MWVYAIRSRTKKYIYVGMASNLQRRLAQHNNGQNRSTKAYRPFDLIYQERVSDRVTARALEKKLKSGYGKEFLKSL